MHANTTPAVADTDLADDADVAASAVAAPVAPAASAVAAPAAPAASAVAAPAAPAGDFAPFFGECIIDRIEQYPGTHQIEWVYMWNRPTKRNRGITGWAKVLQTTNPKLPVGGIFRFHKCFFNPCEADWTSDKYGEMPTPIHVQPYEPSCIADATLTPSAPSLPPEPLVPAVAEPIAIVVEPLEAAPPSDIITTTAEPPAAVAEPPAASPTSAIITTTAEPTAAVAGPSASTEEEEEVTPPQPECIVHAPLPPPAFPPPTTEQVCAPAPPENAKRLLGMRPPLPAKSVPLIQASLQPAPASEQSAPSAVAARASVLRTVLDLAREIRSPRTYVGYIAFILMALTKNKRPIAWEGSASIDLIGVFAPWASDTCSGACAVDVVCCALEAQSSGHARLCAISEDMPLANCRHFVGAAQWLESEAAATAVAETIKGPTEFERMYHKLSRVTIPTILDGDCSFDVMTMMLARPQTLQARTELRTELSDYLIARAEEPWMHDLLVACGELDIEVVKLAREDANAAAAVAESAPVAPAAPIAPAVAESLIQAMPETPTEEVFEAMRWSSGLRQHMALCHLIQQLPPEVVNEQVALYKEHMERTANAAVAEAASIAAKIKITPNALFSARMDVAYAFEQYCERNAIAPRTAAHADVQHFLRTEVDWQRRSLKPYVMTKAVRRWHATWSVTPKAILAKSSGNVARVGPRGRTGKKVPIRRRQRAYGAGAKRKGLLVGKELFEWWSGMRYAIDWKRLSDVNRSRGKKCLARFPRSVLRTKLLQLLEDQAFAALMNGTTPESFNPTSEWFKQWEADHGLTMRRANRKYEVPRYVQKERCQQGWTNLARVRKFCLLRLGYEPRIENWDQSPYHNNETGSQNKPILAVRGGKVPCVEGKSDVKSRWTANLTTSSDVAAIRNGEIPYCQCMFKFETDARKAASLKAYIRSRGFPKWLSVATSPSGSYKEHDVIVFLDEHLEPMYEGRQWRILLADDYSAHKTDNVKRLAWSRGYILLLHGGGVTPILQTVDTDLNEYVRAEYGAREANVLINKMREGSVVPRITPEESLDLMLDILSDPALHIRAAEGYNSTGLNVALDGGQDGLICREAATFWWEHTSDGYENMRAKLNAELAAVAEEVEAGELPWCHQSVERLITPYKKHADADATLERLGDYAGCDGVHRMYKHDEDIEADPAVADASSSASDIDGAASEDAIVIEADEIVSDAAAVAETFAVENDEDAAEVAERHVLGPELAAAVDAHHETLVGLQEAMESCRKAGAIKAMQDLEYELQKETRKGRGLLRVNSAVAEEFLQRRKAEAQVHLRKRLFAEELNNHVLAAKRAKQESAAAVAELKKARDAIKECEIMRECRHAMKTFTPLALGEGSANAGGAAAKKRRFEVLDRVARIGAGLSNGQKNDWVWFKGSWDVAMVAEHKANWGLQFVAWMQGVLDDTTTNAFSLFVYNETCRVFKGTVALHLSG